MVKRKNNHLKIPAIGNLLSSKNLALDVGILLVGFVVIGIASAAGNWTFKYVYNNHLLPGVPAGEKIPY